MSAATKRKHVEREVCNEFVLPTGNQFIVRVVAGRGNNLHEVQNSQGENFLVSMPTKDDPKVRGEILHILLRDQIKHIQKNNLWPESFQGEFSADGKQPDKDDYGIDKDMLPPSYESDADDEGSGSENEDVEDGLSGENQEDQSDLEHSDENTNSHIYNPNRNKGIFVSKEDNIRPL